MPYRWAFFVNGGDYFLCGMEMLERRELLPYAYAKKKSAHHHRSPTQGTIPAMIF